MKKAFRLDKRNGKLMGVCAGIADYTGIDATLVRVGVVVVTLLGAFPWTLIAYGLAAWLARPKASGAIDRASRVSTYAMRTEMRDVDRRMAEIERYVTQPSSRLAREIEELR